MQYLGGKSRIAAALAAQITDRRSGRSTYVEPFLGAGSVALRVAPTFERVIVADVVPDLVLLWQAAVGGWVPPENLTEDDYQALRHAAPSALRGFAGFPCSFGGKWFGGYARDPKGGRNFAASASRSVVKRGRALAGADVRLADYRALGAEIGADSVVYCDPPYAGTTAYAANVEAFDSEEFWKTARNWTRRGALVLVSEYAAPADWIEVWSGTPRTSIAGKGSYATVTERLFAYVPDDVDEVRSSGWSI